MVVRYARSRGRVTQSLLLHNAPVVVWSGSVVANSGRLFLRSTAVRTHVVPRTHHTFGDKSFAAAGPRV